MAPAFRAPAQRASLARALVVAAAGVLFAGLASAEEPPTANDPDPRLSSCRTDTYGLVTSKFSKPYKKGVEDLKCNFSYTDAALIPKFVLNYYPNTSAFASYTGTDMVPERHWEYFRRQHKELLEAWEPGKNGPPGATDRIMLGACDLPQDDGSTISIERVGPLVSVGNYDYWQYSWQDVWSLSRKLQKHPEGIMFQSSFSGAVDPNGKVLGHPPIHIHHIHISPSPGTVVKMDGDACATGVDPSQCYATRLVVEQHGDYQCMPEDGGVDCLFEKTADGYAKVVTTTLDLEGEINDVRAPNSEPMVWWYQVVLHWFPKTEKLTALSQHFNVGPGQMNSSDQRHNVLVFPVATRDRSVYWYSGSMQHQGELVRNKLHSHNTMFDRAFWFAATSADLGLDDPKFWPQVSYHTLQLKEDLGFEDFEALQAFLLSNLAASARRFDRTCPPSQPGCAERRPALICESWVSNEDFLDPVSGISFAYDRRAPACCRPWHFERGATFTVVAFMAPMKTPPGPWTPHYTPPKANMHIHWLMTYATGEDTSHYGITIYTQLPEKQVDISANPQLYPLWYNLEAILVSPSNDGYHNKQLTVRERMFVGYVWFIISSSPYHLELLIGMVAVCAGLLVFCTHLFVRCIRAKRVQDHPMVQCAQQAPCNPQGLAEAAAECVSLTGVVQHGD